MYSKGFNSFLTQIAVYQKPDDMDNMGHRLTDALRALKKDKDPTAPLNLNLYSLDADELIKPNKYQAEEEKKKAQQQEKQQVNNPYSIL